jgi:Concanavalin A-like lectin/glucanases superfamily
MMKTIKHTLIAGLMGLAIVFTISSCQKSFDPKSYAPVKPLPSFDGFSSSNSIETGSLVGYWNFSGSLTDSITKATGVATLTSFAAGISGQALQGAANGYAVCTAPAGLATLQTFTVSAWINTPPPSNGVLDYFTLVNTNQFWGNIEMFFDNGSNNTDAHVRIHMSQNGVDNTYAVEVPNLFNAWVNLIFTYDISGTCTLYVNGASAATGTAGNLKGPLVFTNVGNVVFGCPQFMTTPSQTSGTTAQSWAGYFTGKIDQVRVYNKVLTAHEASALYSLENLGR